MWSTVVCAAAALSACGPPLADQPPPNSFAFGVFGDGPNYLWEEGPFERLIEDVNRADLAWFLHIGDILDRSCSEAVYEKRLAQFNAIRHPVIYTPGDNEWADCHTGRSGGFDPLDRLASLRGVFFRTPGISIGGQPMRVASQAEDSTFSEFPENVRWTFGGFVFATVHVVGSSNGMDGFPGRRGELDAEVVRRTDAGARWIDAAFATAHAMSAKGVVIALHADMGLKPGEPRQGYQRFIQQLAHHAATFAGPVLLIHGDSHTYLVDHPLRDEHDVPYPDFTRLETFGSPEIGWVRVVVDTVAGRFLDFEPRRLRGWG
jgi:hypothetical protein